MTDRELLLLAAKAAGLSLKSRPEVVDADGKFVGIKVRHAKSDPLRLWNPLIHDGCALRLAVKLDLLNSPRVAHEIAVERFTRNADKLTATRRAIVRAAAEIGRCMP